jgi:hypothetical protein
MTQYVIVSNDKITNIVEAESLDVVKELSFGDVFEMPFVDGIGTLRIGMELVDGEWVDPFVEYHKSLPQPE